MAEEQIEIPGIGSPADREGQSFSDVREEFSGLLDEMTLSEPNKEVDQRFKEVLRSLDEEEIRNLLGFRNPARFAKDMLRRGVKERTLADSAKLAFLDSRVSATDEIRTRTDKLLSNLRGSNIKSGVITSFKSNAPSESSDNTDPKPEDMLDKYDFNEAGRHCTMAMVVRVQDDGAVDFVTPHVPLGPPNTKKGLKEFWSKNFKYDQPNRYFVFLKGGRWHVIDSGGKGLPISKEDLTQMWREAIKRKNKMH